MGYEDFTAGEIIRQEFGAMGYLKPTGGNNGLTAAGRNLLNGGNLDSNYDYNVFDNSADVGNDTSYMGVMYNGSTGGGSPTATMNNTQWWSNSTFDLAHTGINIVPSGGTTQGGTTGAAGGNIGFRTDFDLAHTYANPLPSGGTTSGSVASNYTGYKMDKDKDGKYCVTYYIDGQKVTRDKFAAKYKDDAAKATAELKRLNG